jgi:hypothetical protein
MAIRPSFPGHSDFAPVVIRDTRSGAKRTISTVHDAANFLLEEWPVTPDKLFGAVATACRAFMRGNASTDEVRAAFIEAAKEAGIYVDDSNNIT